MANFLRVNGYPIDVAIENTEERLTEIGSRSRAFNGRPTLERRNTLRSWIGQTKPLQEMQALMVEGMLRGLGETFPFDADLYSAGGLKALGTPVGGLRFGVAAVGAKPIWDGNNVPEVKYGAKSLGPDSAVTNILSSDSATAENAPTGYSAIGGASLAASTARAVQGTKSLEVTSSSTLEGAQTTPAAASASTAYAASVYVYSASSLTLRLRLHGNVSGTIGTFDFSTATAAGSAWSRIQVTGTTGGSDSTIWLSVVTLGSGGVFYMDACMIHTGSKAKTWVDGSRSTTSLGYDAKMLHGPGMTFLCWAKGPTANPSGNVTLGVVSQAINTNSLEFYRPATLNRLRLVWWDPSGGGGSLDYSTSPWDGQWHHVGFTWGWASDGSNKPFAKLYYDGDEKAVAAPTTWPDMHDMVKFWVGSSDAPGEHFADPIDDVIVLPYAMNEAGIAAIYGMGKAMSPLPRVYVDGDLIPDPALEVLALGSVESARYVGATVDITGHETNLRALGFSLDEWGVP